MDLLTIIKLALFVPFLLMLTIFAIVYLIAGYKKDLGRSIISLLATVLATGISLLFAKLIGMLVSGPIYSVISSAMGDAGASVGALGDGFIKGVVEIVLSFVLFVVFFIINLAVLKSVGKKINWGKLENLNTGKSGTRFAGLLLRAVDAVLVSVMLLLPLYGTIAMVAPPAAAILRISKSTSAGETVMQAKEDITPSVQLAAVGYAAAMPGGVSDEPDASEILDVLANHPVLVPYKYGPGAWVYTELTTFSMNGKQVDIATAAESLEGLLDRFETFRVAIESDDEARILSATEGLIDFARKKVVNQRWSYDMVMALVGEADKMIEQYSDELMLDEEFDRMYAALRPLFDMTFEEYTHNAEGLLDFAAWVLDKYNDIMKLQNLGNLENMSEMEAISLITGLVDEGFERMGSLLNHSKQAVGLKRFILQMLAEERLFDTVPSRISATAFIDKYYGDGFVDEKDRKIEAAAFIAFLDAKRPLDVAAAFARHPLFGADAVIDTFGNDLYIYGLSDGLSQSLKESDKAEQAYEALNEMLRGCEGFSLIQQFTSFDDAARFYLTEELGLEYGYGGGSFGAGDVVKLSIKQGYDGKWYLIPEEYDDELAGYDILDEKTIKKYGLEPLNVVESTEGGGGSFSYSSSDIGSISKIEISK